MNRLAILAILLLPIPLAHAAELPKIASITDLYDTPLTHLSTGWDVHLGYADPGPDAGPWVFLYCDAHYIVNGPRPGTAKDRDPNTLLGPMVVKTSWDDLKELDMKASATSQNLIDGLYCMAIATAFPGKRRISVEDYAGQQVAQKDIFITGTPAIYWQTAPAAQSWAAMPIYRGTSLIDLADLQTKDTIGAAALFKSTLPCTLPTDFRWFAKPPLPEKSDPNAFPLTLSLQNTAFIINTNGRQVVDWPDWYLIARWWVNGTLKEAQRPKQLHGRSLGRLISYTGRLTLPFAYPDSLGALKLGDKVSLQVLYTTDYTEIAADRNQGISIFPTSNRIPIPLLSNKLDFTLTQELMDARSKNNIP